MVQSEQCPLCPSCFGAIFSFFRFERPGRNAVVTEHVQPLPNAHSGLNEQLGVSRQGNNSYQAMSNTTNHRVSTVQIFY